MVRTRPTAILLDLDDTILDDSGAAAESWRVACEAHAEALGATDVAVLLEAIHRVRRWYWSDPERHRVGRLDLLAATAHVVAAAMTEVGAVDDRRVALDIATTYRALRDAALAPFPGAIETVQRLRAAGYRLALLTNGAARAQREKVERFALAPLFDEIFIEGEVGFGKPDPRVYRRALDALGADPAEAWMVGDNLEWDVAQPQRMGVTGVWVDRWRTGVPAGRDVRPDRVIHALAELERLIG